MSRLMALPRCCTGFSTEPRHLINPDPGRERCDFLIFSRTWPVAAPLCEARDMCLVKPGPRRPQGHGCDGYRTRRCFTGLGRDLLLEEDPCETQPAAARLAFVHPHRVSAARGLAPDLHSLTKK